MRAYEGIIPGEAVHERVREGLAPLTDAQLATIADLLARIAPPMLGPPRDLLADLRHDAPAQRQDRSAKAPKRRSR